jgi:hypothetical protein
MFSILRKPIGTTSDGQANSLYDLVYRVFGCQMSDVRLYGQDYGAFRDKSHNGWKGVGHQDDVQVGAYLCRADKGMSPFSLN